jgi:hypothetical protein
MLPKLAKPDERRVTAEGLRVDDGIIGGLVAAPYYHEGPYRYYYPGYYAPLYVGPIGYGAPGWEAYCSSRYRSFDPINGTYLGYDGRRRYCR